jgi:lipopolysaccharide transport system permease protein
MVGVVEGFRWALLGGNQYSPGPMFVVSALASVALLISGAFYFRRMEKTFADIV